MIPSEAWGARRAGSHGRDCCFPPWPRPRCAAEGHKGELFPSDAGRYPDPLTEIEVYRLTKPDYSSTLTAYYNRGISHNSAWMLCASDRTGARQGFRLDLKSGEMKQMTQAEGLDGSDAHAAARQPLVLLSGGTVGVHLRACPT